MSVLRSLIIFSVICIKSFSSTCISGDILGATGDGIKRCDVFGMTRDDRPMPFWFICRVIKKSGSGAVTDPYPQEFAEKFRSFLTTKSISFVDLFRRNNVTIGMGFDGTNKLVCFSLANIALEAQYQTVVDCGTIGVTLPSDTTGLTGVETISNVGDDKLTIFSFKFERDDDKFVVIDERTKSTQTSIIKDDHSFIAIAYLGVSKTSKKPLIGGFTDHDVIIVYEVDGLQVTKVVDERLNGPYHGCTVHMCLEGDVDVVYSFYTGQDDAVSTIFGTLYKSIYVIRKYNLYKLDEIGTELTLLKTDVEQSTSGINFDYDTAFVVWTDTAPKICYLVHSWNQVVLRDINNNNAVYVMSKIFPEIKNHKIFTVIQINSTNHYLFSEDNLIYEYEHIKSSANFTMKFIKIHKINDRFKNLWKTFDAAFIDHRNNRDVYFFNQDFNIRYKWSDIGLMAPIDSEPRLNQKTFWTCNASTDTTIPDGGWLSHRFGVNSLDEYYEKIAKKYRYVPIIIDKQPETTTTRTTRKRTKKPTKVPTESDKSSDGQPKWLLPVIIVASITAIIILIALIFLCYYKVKTRTNSSSEVAGSKIRRKSPPSFVSISTQNTTVNPSKASKSRMK